MLGVWLLLREGDGYTWLLCSVGSWLLLYHRLLGLVVQWTGVGLNMNFVKTPTHGSKLPSVVRKSRVMLIRV